MTGQVFTGKRECCCFVAFPAVQREARTIAKAEGHQLVAVFLALQHDSAPLGQDFHFPAFKGQKTAAAAGGPDVCGFAGR